MRLESDRAKIVRLMQAAENGLLERLDPLVRTWTSSLMAAATMGGLPSEYRLPREDRFRAALRDHARDSLKGGYSYTGEQLIAHLEKALARVKRGTFADEPQYRLPLDPEDLAAVIADQKHITVQPVRGLAAYEQRSLQLARVTQEDLLQAAKDQVTGSIASGKGLREIQAGLHLWFPSFAEARLHNIARTESSHLFNAGRWDHYQQSDAVWGYRFRAIQDERTTQICSFLDGSTFPKGEEAGRLPPLHFQCRSTLDPVMYFEAGAAGFEWDRKPLWEGPMEGFGSLPEGMTPGRVPPGLGTIGRVPVPEVPRARPITVEEMQASNTRWETTLDRFEAVEEAGVTKDRIAKELSERLLTNEDWKGYFAEQLGFPDWAEAVQTVGRDRMLRMNEQRIAAWVDQWAATSGDENPMAIVMQMAVKEEFGLEAAAMGHLEKGAKEVAESLYVEHGAGMRAFARAMYENTQEFLAKQGVDEVVLYRGAGIPTKTLQRMFPAGRGTFARDVDIVLQPASSYSTRVGAARRFATRANSETSAGTIVVERISAKDILGTCQTGFGCKDETEMVILGGKRQAAGYSLGSQYDPAVMSENVLLQGLSKVIGAAP